MSFLYALISHTKLITPSELYTLCKPLELNAQHCAAAWGLQAPAVVVASKPDGLGRYISPLVFVDGDGDPGALAVHYGTIFGIPAGIVYADRASGLNIGSHSVCESAGHEVLEGLVSPSANSWVPHPDPARVGVEVAEEVADPVQDTYEIEVAGKNWKLPNFVTPAWFSRSAHDPEIKARVLAGRGFDHAKRLHGPGHIGREGYVVLREKVDGRWVQWFETPDGQRFGSAPTGNARAAAQSGSPTSRTKRLTTAAAAPA